MALGGWTADGTFGANRLEGITALKEVPIPASVGVIGKGGFLLISVSHHSTNLPSSRIHLGWAGEAG